MAKADMKKIAAEVFKKHGLELGEEATALVVEAAFEIGEALIKASDNKFDDMLLVVMPIAKRQILELVDKIDGEDDEGR